jgi:hypothetical protein
LGTFTQAPLEFHRFDEGVIDDWRRSGAMRELITLSWVHCFSIRWDRELPLDES